MRVQVPRQALPDATTAILPVQCRASAAQNATESHRRDMPRIKSARITPWLSFDLLVGNTACAIAAKSRFKNGCVKIKQKSERKRSMQLARKYMHITKTR